VLKKLESILTRKDKFFIFNLFLFSILISIIETVGISAIMPFISVASDFTLIHNNDYYKYIYNSFSFSDDVSFVIIFGVLLIAFYFFRSIINLYYLYQLSNFTEGRYSLLVNRLFKNYMEMSYGKFVMRNSSTLTKTIVNEAANLTQLISSALLMMSEIFVIIFIYMAMLYIDYTITLIITFILLLNAVLMLKTVSKKIKQVGVIREKVQKQFYEIINKSFGNFKLLKLQNNRKNMLSDFEEASLNYSKANITNATLTSVPRLFLEAIGFSLILIIIIYAVWKNNRDISEFIAVISMFVLALYRLMPSVNRIITGYNRIMFYHKSLDIIYSDLEYKTEIMGSEDILFNNDIKIKDLYFSYEQNKPVLKNINLSIKKGDKIAFIGESGSGKTTLVDLIIGLYKPQSGSIASDNIQINDLNIERWRSKIGYIPQSVYLFDGTVGENVAFGLPYDENKINYVLKQAKIYDFLKTKKGKDTFVGEGGIMLSGGQKQRIAIARALYIEPEILVLDEATSALDDKTEKDIMDEIYEISGDKTLIIIAHRLSTLGGCNIIYKLENGELKNVQQ